MRPLSQEGTLAQKQKSMQIFLIYFGVIMNLIIIINNNNKYKQMNINKLKNKI